MIICSSACAPSIIVIDSTARSHSACSAGLPGTIWRRRRPRSMQAWAGVGGISCRNGIWIWIFATRKMSRATTYWPPIPKDCARTASIRSRARRCICLGISDMQRPPLPPFTEETAHQKVRMAEDAWNTRDPARVALAYTIDSRWRNRAEFLTGREAIQAFLTRKWSRELDYRLIKALWAFRD